MSEQKLSVIISVHNCEDYISECLEDLFNQTRPADEIIIVLDASTDNTLDIVKQWTEKLPITILENKERMGKPFSLNRAIDMASGDFIAQVDADDTSHPRRFELQLRFLNRNSDVDVCGTCDHRFGNISEQLKRPLHNSQIRWWLLMCSSPFLHTSVIYRSSTLEKYKLRYNSDFIFMQDFNLFVKMIEKGLRFANLPQDLVGWRAHSDNTSHPKNDEKRNDYRKQILEQILMLAGVDATPEEMEAHRSLGKMRLSGSYRKNLIPFLKWCFTLMRASVREPKFCPAWYSIINISARIFVTVLRKPE